MRVKAQTNVVVGTPPSAFHEGEERDVPDAYGRELLSSTHFVRVDATPAPTPAAIPETAVAGSRGERAVRPVRASR